jgi:two-component system chemotaxis response regulator CheB
MVCDDSAVIRGAVARMLDADLGVKVVARVSNGQLAIDELKRTPVDVLVLDIEMPVMDGMTALPLLLRADPGLKVIMASTLTTRGADVALRALRLGAADYVPKPSAVTGDETFRRELVEKVKGLGRMRRRVAQPARDMVGLRLRPAAIVPPRLLAVGSSTGGPPGAVHPGAGSWQDAQRAGCAHAAHARDIHAHTRRAHQQARRHALCGSEGR